VSNHMPMGHVVVVHGCAPTEHKVLGDEVQYHRNNHENRGDVQERHQFAHVFAKGDGTRLTQGSLDEIVKAAEPFVDLDVQVHLVLGGAEDDHRDDPGPEEPFTVQEKTIGT
jgi:hypothetical protein